MAEVKYVWVVTSVEMGWDCVCGVYDANTVTQDDLKEIWTSDSYVFHHKKLETEAKPF